MSVPEALERLATMVARLPSESVPLEAAYGRVAAKDVAAPVSVPHFRRAAMDGYAARGSDTFGASELTPVELDVVDRSRPGSPAEREVGPRQAIAIATGAPVPDGADVVVMAERTEPMDSEGKRIAVTAPFAPGKHVGQVGEDISKGSVVVPEGRRLRPQDVGVLASVGQARVDVVRSPTARILITGDEILPPGQAPEGSRIVDSNSPVLRALVDRDGGSTTVQYVRDGRETVREAMAGAQEDVVLISGGSSVGPEDHAPSLLRELGEVVVHGVAMRPSGPTGFGRLGSRLAFLLPGNPVSCLCAYEFFAGPAIRALGGRPMAWPHARFEGCLTDKIVSELGRTDYCRVQIDGDRVVPIMTSGASILSSTTRADGVVIVDEGLEGYADGERVTVLRY